jgi:hypothetical protein
MAHSLRQVNLLCLRKKSIASSLASHGKPRAFIQLTCADACTSQPHSSLNRFIKEDDAKSALIVTCLSYVEAIRPQLCVFENVSGFVKWQLMGVKDKGAQRIQGGIEMGGLKLIMRCLTDLG